MFILQALAWFVFSWIVMSFLEHQIHRQLMHRENPLSRRYPSFKRTFESHAITHHKYYYDIFSDAPVPDGDDKDIRLTVHKAPIKALPFALLIAPFSLMGACSLLIVVTMHHWIWNKIHLEMHKPENRPFSKWRIYKFLACHHYLHHRHPNRNFNVTCLVADYVLGTVAKPKPEDLQAMVDAGWRDAPHSAVAS